MGLRAVSADRLAFALANAQRRNHRRSKHEDDQCGGKHCRTGTEGDVPEQVENLNMVSQFDKPDQHNCPFSKAVLVLGFRVGEWRMLVKQSGYNLAETNTKRRF
ncbi:hypothetical protein D3C80_1813080 [compost metagenome]